MLHVVEGCRDLCDPMAGVLSDLGIEAVACSDVYGALACLHRRDRSHFGAVVVCVDYLASREFEFFALAKGACGDLSVLAYSAADRVGRVDRAVFFGATGVVRADRASVAAALGAGPATVEVNAGEAAGDASSGRVGADVVAESRISEAARGPLLSEEEIRMLLFDGGEAEAVGRRKGIV